MAPLAHTPTPAQLPQVHDELQVFVPQLPQPADWLGAHGPSPWQEPSGSHLQAALHLYFCWPQLPHGSFLVVPVWHSQGTVSGDGRGPSTFTSGLASGGLPPSPASGGAPLEHVPALQIPEMHHSSRRQGAPLGTLPVSQTTLAHTSLLQSEFLVHGVPLSPGPSDLQI